MSFGFSPSDVVLLVQLAWRTVRNSRKACGEYAELTRDITSLHVNLQRLERETAKSESPINRPSDTCRQDLGPIVDGCRKALDVLNRILEKYNALSDEERSKGRLWKAVRFGNGELANVRDLRLKLTYYTSNLSLFLNMVSMGSMGIVEKQMYEARGDLKDIRRAVNGITAQFMSGASKEGSVLTDYAGDDKVVWRAFRRELVKGGFSSDVIREHKDTIQAYVRELGSRGVLDDEDLKDSGNVSEAFEDTETGPATPQSRDKAMGLFESESGAARDAVSPRTATTAHVDEIFEIGNRDPRENRAFPQQTQIAAAPLTMNNVSDTLPSTIQADAEIDSVVESDSIEVEKVDDRTSTHRSSAPIFPSSQISAELAEEDIRPKAVGELFRICFFGYYKYHRGYGFTGAYDFTGYTKKAFDILSNPLIGRGETLEFQEEATDFLEVAQLRTRLQYSDTKQEGEILLRLSPLFDKSKLSSFPGVSGLEHHGHPHTIISDLLQYGLRWIDARPEKWRITTWQSPREKAKREGRKDGDKGKRRIAPSHAAPAVGKGTQDRSSTTKEVETEKDKEIRRTGDDSGTEEGKRSWEALVKEAQLMKKPPHKIVTQAFYQPRHL